MLAFCFWRAAHACTRMLIACDSQQVQRPHTNTPSVYEGGVVGVAEGSFWGRFLALALAL